MGLSKESETKLKAKVKAITQRSRGISFAQVVKEVNQVFRGWHTYFRYAANADKNSEARWMDKTQTTMLPIKAMQTSDRHSKISTQGEDRRKAKLEDRRMVEIIQHTCNEHGYERFLVGTRRVL